VVHDIQTVHCDCLVLVRFHIDHHDDRVLTYRLELGSQRVFQRLPVGSVQLLGHQHPVSASEWSNRPAQNDGQQNSGDIQCNLGVGLHHDVGEQPDKLHFEESAELQVQNPFRNGSNLEVAGTQQTE